MWMLLLSGQSARANTIIEGTDKNFNFSGGIKNDSDASLRLSNSDKFAFSGPTPRGRRMYSKLG